jgi:hypothetical protein
MCRIEADVNAQDYYRVLGVGQQATDKDITAAYRRLALKYHPDKNPDPEKRDQAEETFKKVTEAYENLHDEQKRQEYDRFGKSGAAPSARGAGRGGGASTSFAGADEIFNRFFGGGMPGGSPSGAFGQNAGPRSCGTFRMDHGGGLGGGSYNRSAFGDNFGSAFGADLDGLLGGHSRPSRGTPTRGNKGSTPSTPPPAHAMSAGAKVVVHGLLGSPEHNGKSGKVLGWEQLKGRYEVQLEDGGVTLSLRAKNLTQRCQIQVSNLECKPELNGQTGEIFNFDDEKGRYMVLLTSPPVAIGLQPGNCMLEQGRRVVLQGLSEDQLNGQMAQILEVDSGALRYTLQCECGRIVKVKFDKVVC